MPTAAIDLSHIPTSLVAPAVPKGFETLWGFLARTEPATLALMIDPVAELALDELNARHITGQLGLDFVLVEVPSAVKAKGISNVGAYRIPVLKRVFPVNP